MAETAMSRHGMVAPGWGRGAGLVVTSIGGMLPPLGTFRGCGDMAARAIEEGARPIVLVGLMGAGKTSIGRLLARRLGLAFTDADDEIVKASGCSIADFFRLYGESAFRDGERRVMARLLDAGPGVVASGGGAFIDAETRAAIAARATSVWLRAGLDVLLARTVGRTTRPLLNNADPRAVLEILIAERYPIYAEADIVADTTNEAKDVTVDRIIRALSAAGALRA